MQKGVADDKKELERVKDQNARQVQRQDKQSLKFTQYNPNGTTTQRPSFHDPTNGSAAMVQVTSQTILRRA